ncbi:MAG: hypothetical protein ACYDAO_05155 [Thermoplasmataceae archaeon]
MFEKKVTNEMIQKGRQILKEGSNAEDVASEWRMSKSTVQKYLGKEVNEATKKRLDKLSER